MKAAVIAKANNKNLFIHILSKTVIDIEFELNANCMEERKEKKK